MAGQRPHKRSRELPARPVTLDGHRQRLLAGDAGRPDEEHHVDSEGRGGRQVSILRQASDNKLVIGQATRGFVSVLFHSVVEMTTILLLSGTFWVHSLE
jgi:hypothetical protein